MVSLSIDADFSSIDTMISKFGARATKEYKTAINRSGVSGLREFKSRTPVRTANAKNRWKFEFNGELIASIFNDAKYIEDLDMGWKRNNPILPKTAKVLVFQVGKKTAAKSSTTTLMNRYKQASKSLKGKGLSQLEKARQATAKSGVVVTRRVDSPASYKGANFITPTFNKLANLFEKEVASATGRLIG